MIVVFKMPNEEFALTEFSRICDGVPRIGDEIQLEYTNKKYKETFEVVRVVWKEDGAHLMPVVHLKIK